MKELASLELFAVSELYVTHEPVPHPRKWVGLTNEERLACTGSPFTDENYRAIEAKLKEKNT
jgi:hypothetical protein